jgi:hypothetical protein
VQRDLAVLTSAWENSRVAAGERWWSTGLLQPQRAFLDVLRKNVGYALDRLTGHEEPDADEIMRHSAIALVFSAAGVESALNSFVSRPLLSISDPATREFFATLLHKHFRANLPEKLKFLRRLLPALNEQKILLKKVEVLASARNGLLHIYPDYLVAAGPRGDARWPLSEADWIEYPDLRWTKQHLADTQQAKTGYSTAVAFIDALPMTLPEYEAMKIAFDSQQTGGGDAEDRAPHP